MGEYIYDISEAGYGQDSPVPRFKPLKIADKIYIFGRQFGICLSRRSKEEPRVACELITGDDGNWYSCTEQVTFDSGWITDIQKLFNYTQNYLEIDNHFKKDRYGYIFKEDTNMKKYRVYYTIKMNSSAYEYYLDVEAPNATLAKGLVRSEIFEHTGRNAFNPSTKMPKTEAIEGMPPKKPEWPEDKV